MHPQLCYDASLAHMSGRGDKQKIDNFRLVTARPIAHSGGCACI